jgi:cytochrome c biogenesis protein CcmG, thiol:disulfide interchange protein DsbE
MMIPPLLRALTAASCLMLAPVALQARPVVGKPSPDFTITLVDKSKIDFAALKGQVVVINFWATWCVPCRTELPLLDAYYRKLAPHGLKVFAITTEDSVPINQLRKLFAALAISSGRRITGGYDIMSGVPTNYVIDRKGVVRYAKAGALELDDLNSVIVPLLNEPVG